MNCAQPHGVAPAASWDVGASACRRRIRGLDHHLKHTAAAKLARHTT